MTVVEVPGQNLFIKLMSECPLGLRVDTSFYCPRYKLCTSEPPTSITLTTISTTEKTKTTTAVTQPRLCGGGGERGGSGLGGRLVASEVTYR